MPGGKVSVARPEPVGPAGRRLLASTITRFTCTTWPPASSTPSSAVTRLRRPPWRIARTASKWPPASNDQTIRLWDPATGQQTGPSQGGSRPTQPGSQPRRGVQLGRQPDCLLFSSMGWRGRHEPVVGRDHRQGDRRPGEMAGDRLVRSPLAPMASGWQWVPGSTSTCATPSRAAGLPSWALTRSRSGCLAYSPDGKRIASHCRRFQHHSPLGWRERQGSRRVARPHGRCHFGASSARTGRGWFPGAITRITRRASGTRPPAGRWLSSPDTRMPSGRLPSARTASGWPPPRRTRRRGSGTGTRGSCWPSWAGIRAGCVHVLFSPNGTRVVTASDDATLRLWDAQTGELIGVLRGHGDGFHRIVRRSSRPTAPAWCPAPQMARCASGI